MIGGSLIRRIQRGLKIRKKRISTDKPEKELCPLYAAGVEGTGSEGVMI